MSKHELEKAQRTALQQPIPAHTHLTPFEEMDRWFDDIFQHHWMSPFSRRRWLDWPGFEPMFGGGRPRVDVIDRPDEILVRAELPGVAKDDLDVSIGDSSLTIHASAKHEKSEKSEHFFRRELSCGEFQRTVDLPSGVDGDKAKACFKDGILELTIPKAEGAKRKTIKID